jgi:N-dimethylarginine dimethylaminohydrolase
MLINNTRELRTWLNSKPELKTHLPAFDGVAMVSPDHFTVSYSINPYMKDADGNLNKIDGELAKKQWADLKATYERIGFQVEVLTGHAALPDMVFAANQSFPYRSPSTGERSVFLSRMRAPQRRAEVEYFDHFYRDREYNIEQTRDPKACVEGNGDLLIHPELPVVIAGYGYRTDLVVLEEMSQRLGLTLFPVKLLSEDFYHLDTCLSIMNGNTALIQRTAFEPEAFAGLSLLFPDLIEVDRATNVKNFTCNSHCPNGRDVIIQKGSSAVEQQLTKRGFVVHPVDTSEFMKSGGSVFCMKQMFWTK